MCLVTGSDNASSTTNIDAFATQLSSLLCAGFKQLRHDAFANIWHAFLLLYLLG